MRTHHHRQPAIRRAGDDTLRTFRRSAIALGVATLLSAPLHAQTTGASAPAGTDATNLDTVVVKGVRGAVMRAQDIKQDAPQIIDSVTAEDIGALPDRSVTETLKRISGLTVTGFAARDDTDHFSAEGSGVMIRGLTFVRGELNGRDVFTANGGRGISFEEVSAELMAGVDVYKNPSAEIIEGGLGGTINLRTRMPFDEPGRKIAGSVDANYGDKAKDARPSASFLFSDRWDTGVGEMGFLANVSYSELATQSDGIQIQPYSRRGRTPAEQPEGLPNGEGWVYDWEQEAWVSSDSQRDLLLEGSGRDQVFVPGGVNWRRTDFDRKRQGGAFAFQWRPNDDTEIYTQFITSKYDMTWREHFMEYAGAGEANNTDNWTGDPNYYGNAYDGGDGLADRTNRLIPMPGTQFEYDENGRFLRGSIRLGGWRGQPGDDSNGMYQGPGIQFVAGNRHNVQSSQTTDWSAGFRHFISDNFLVRGDFQYVKAESDQVDFSVHTSTLLEGITLDLTGKYPSVTLDNPDRALQQDTYFWRSAMDHLADNEGHERAGRVDFEYNFPDSTWLRTFRFGGRVADREYTSFYTTYNWQPISDDWNRIENPDPTRPPVAWLDQFYSSESALYTLEDFFGGDATVPTQFWAARDGFVDIGRVRDTLSTIPGAQWNPIQFSPDAINQQRERTQAAYGVLYFGNDELRNPVDGNLGVRVVKTSVKAVGGGLLPDMTGAYVEDVAQEVRDAFYGQAFTSTVNTSYTDVLPSLNVRVRFDHGLQWRFAASKAIARPEFRLMQNWITLGANAAGCAQAREDGLREELCSFDDLAYSGSGGNPELKPMRADQFDTALEWYFGPANSAYITLFKKDVEDYFATSLGTEIIDGRVYQMNRTRNLDEGKIKGFELGYSQFFDFLPGLGVQANYTFVDSSGGTNVDVGPPDGAPTVPEVALELPLEGLSRRSYNLIGIFERGPVSFRLAYNWRSRYLLTSSDVMPAMRQPVWNDDYGQLDGSFFYNLTDNIQLGLQVNNITNSTTKLLMGPRGYRRDGFVDETLYNRAWFENDRRYSAVLRASW
ncbi:TonB-dependent receptor [Luteimonas sp. M1R5S18]|uniref:TonB-dependent receptor n=1 Tax=Luteimonas rhizosphaericola TaxID=3042024 RepID=A0ABT6JKC1_9GAMM|nr:TonB-dependent receptor [Luteimonas rhizosphaericola]MDH5831110.1 TonB-dependent receptor [Luteimonas rhizosphaericola]